MSGERARDALGRPLPRDADPDLIVPSVPALVALSDVDAWALAMAYLDRALPFHAHEVFELRWRQCPEGERMAWRALAQWGAALTHAARGNPVGAREVARRALVNLDEAGMVPECVDVARVRASCLDLIDLQ